LAPQFVRTTKEETAMGLIDFIKNAGHKLGLGHDTPAAHAPAAAPTGEDFRLAIDRRRAEAMEKLVRDAGLRVDGLDIQVHDDTATVHGQAHSQADREKIVLMVGNIDGVGHVDDRLAVLELAANTTAAPSEYYTVKSGDTLSKIAKHYYGDANKYPQIFEANKPMLSDPDKIYPGQMLRIPGVAVTQRA
jgi:nucleoid-associated protein YgaU